MGRFYRVHPEPKLTFWARDSKYQPKPLVRRSGTEGFSIAWKMVYPFVAEYLFPFAIAVLVLYLLYGLAVYLLT